MALPDPYPRELVFVRHAESVGNVRTHQEKTRMPVGTNYFKLTARGERQAEITGRWLREHFPKPDRVISSHYVRPMQTALAAYPDENMRIEPLLAELDRGIYSVLTDDEVGEKYPEEIRRKELVGLYHYRPIGGESWPDAERRVREFRRSVRCNFPLKRVAAFGHSHWLLLWQRIYHAWSIEETVEKFKRQEYVDNASVLIFRDGGHDEHSGRRVLLHNPECDYVIPWKDHPDMTGF